MGSASNVICGDTPSTSYSHQAFQKPAYAPQRSRRRLAFRAAKSHHKEADDVWNRLDLVNRKLAVAISEEDYTQAAQLSSQKTDLSQQLPPVSQYVFHQVQQLTKGTDLDKVQAIKALGSTGDAEHALPQLMICLKDFRLSSAAFEAIYNIFIWHPDPDITHLMNQACILMATDRDAATSILDRIIQLQPQYYEAWNKRATVLYLAKEFERSIEDCQMALQLQPDHFLAMSGMGLCYIGLDKCDQASYWMQQSLKLHPHMEQIQMYVDKLKSRGFTGTSPS